MKWCDVMAYYAKHSHLFSEINLYRNIFDVKFSIWVFHFLFSLALCVGTEKSLMNFLECTLWAVKPEKYAPRKVFFFFFITIFPLETISRKELMLSTIITETAKEYYEIRMEIILKEKCDSIKSLFGINLHKKGEKKIYDIRLSGWFYMKLVCKKKIIWRKKTCESNTPKFFERENCYYII